MDGDALLGPHHFVTLITTAAIPCLMICSASDAAWLRICQMAEAADCDERSQQQQQQNPSEKLSVGTGNVDKAHAPVAAQEEGHPHGLARVHSGAFRVPPKIEVFSR